jgi:hypothetical protein
VTRRWWLVLSFAGALGCGRVDRDIGSLSPELGQAGAGDQDASADAGSPLDLSKPWKSSGCGRALPEQQIPTITGRATGYTRWQVEQNGETLSENVATLTGVRSFFVRVPADYEPNRPYRIVYLPRGGCDGISHTSTGSYRLYDESLGGDEQAIYVDVATVESSPDENCYDTTTGSDSVEYQAFDLIHTFVESRYCVDNNRIFVAGYRQGAAEANMWGCYFGGIPEPARKFAPRWAIRGHAAVGGWREANQPLPCNGPGAGLWIHEADDNTQGMYGTKTGALVLALSTDACSGSYDDGPKQPWAAAADLPGLGSEACQRYTGCSRQTLSDFPLIFCDIPGDGRTERAEVAIPALTAFFRTMDPSP